MMKKKPVSERDKFEYLLERLQFKNSLRDDRDNILILAVYGEYVINYFFEKNFPNTYKRIRQNAIKISLLYDKGLISQDESDVLRVLGEVRNKIAHELITDETMKKINGAIAKVKLVEDGKWRSLEDRREFIRDYPYSKFQMSCVTVISGLMKKLAKEKNEKFSPVGNFKPLKGKGAHPYYAVFAYEINSLIDQEKHKGITIKEVREITEKNNIIDYLEKKFPGEVDFSGINRNNRKEINENLNSFFNGYYGQEKRKFGVSNNGFNLILSYLISIMQEKIAEHIYLKPREVTKYPEIDR